MEASPKIHLTWNNSPQRFVSFGKKENSLPDVIQSARPTLFRTCAMALVSVCWHRERRSVLLFAGYTAPIDGCASRRVVMIGSIKELCTYTCNTAEGKCSAGWKVIHVFSSVSIIRLEGEEVFIS